MQGVWSILIVQNLVIVVISVMFELNWRQAQLVNELGKDTLNEYRGLPFC